MGKRLFLIADWFAFVIMPMLLGVITLTSGNDHIYKEWGSMSMNVLYLIMFMKPLIVIAGYRAGYTLLPYRRQLGMLAFWLAAFHTGGLIVAKNFWNISAYLTNPLTNYLFIGVFAMLGMVVLAATSNFYSIKMFGKSWKKIQWIAYPVLFLGKLHGDMSKGASGMRHQIGNLGTGTETAREGFNVVKNKTLGTNNALATGTTTVSYTRYIPTLILLVIFIVLKYRQHKVQTKQRRTIETILASSNT